MVTRARRQVRNLLVQLGDSVQKDVRAIPEGAARGALEAAVKPAIRTSWRGLTQGGSPGQLGPAPHYQVLLDPPASENRPRSAADPPSR